MHFKLKPMSSLKVARILLASEKLLAHGSQAGGKPGQAPGLQISRGLLVFKIVNY